MDILQQYNIDIFKLSNSTHEYKFEVDDTFFDRYYNDLIESGTAKINVSLAKSATFIEMQFDIIGSVELTCDRSLENFFEPVKSSNKMLFKYGDDWEELSDEIVMISRDEQRINVGQFIYEFISLALPMKKIHPKLRNQDDEGIMYTSEGKEGTETINDPRWDKLKGLIK